jgi:hypothetical protein
MYEKNPGHDPLSAWIPNFYLKSLDMDEINYILEAEPHIKLVEKSNRHPWTDDFPPTQFWFNDIGIYIKSFLIFNASVLFITQLSNYDNVMYRAEIIPSIAASPRDVKDTRLEDFTEGQKYILYLHHNSNRLRIYVEGEESPRWELMNAGKEFIENFTKFPNRGHWPGDKDYKSYLAPDIFEPWPVLTLTEIKTLIAGRERQAGSLSGPADESRMYRSEFRLRLRSRPDTGGTVLVTIPKGTRVKLLEMGKTETVDGMSAPWVKVLLEDGGEGWCFSGYLKEAGEEPEAPPAAAPETPPSAGTEKAAREGGGGIPYTALVGGGAAIAVAGIVILLVTRRKKKHSAP